MAGMFANTDWRSALMAFASGMMARRNPQAAQSLFGMLQAKQQQALEEQQYQRKRQDTMADWVQQNQWKLDHDKPEYGEFERALIASGVQPGTPGWVAAMKRRADNMLDPIVNTIQGPVLRSMVTGGMGVPTAPVGTLTPIEDDGGPTPPASGGFPGY